MDASDENMTFSPRELCFESGILSAAGHKRTTNEDYALAYIPDDAGLRQNAGCLFIVADGEGGRINGETVSCYAAQKALSHFYDLSDIPLRDRLENIFRKVNDDLLGCAEDCEPVYCQATMVAAVIVNSTLAIANVGNSRAYLIHDGQAQQITRDHTQVNEFLRMESLPIEEIERAGEQNKLTRALGARRDVEADIFSDIQLYPGDVILLCSDGLTRYVDDERIALLVGTGDPMQDCHQLVNWARGSGAEDDVTALVVAIKSNDVDQADLSPKTNTIHRPEALSISPAALTDQPRKQESRMVRRLWVVTGLFLAFILVVIMGGWLISGLLIEQSLDKTTPTRTIQAFRVSAVFQTAAPQPVTTESIRNSRDISRTPSPVLSSESVCVYPVQAGQSLFSIIRRFDLKYNAASTYYYYETCNLQEARCSGDRLVIEIHSEILAGWNIIIPVNDPNACEQSGGIWVDTNEKLLGN